MKKKTLISFLLLLCCFSSSLSISDDIFTSIGRNLLQNKKPCPQSFEFLNYTIITSRCKAPQYPVMPCCDAFKELACPYSDYLNDASTDCTDKLFGYINTIGNYSVGFFATICRDDKIGLICPALPPGTGGNPVGADSNNSLNIHSSSLLMLTVGYLFLLFLWM